jgi:DNA modification methylase
MKEQLLRGDCLELLATLPAESIDACVTDPPYGIGFMGKEWDRFDVDAVEASWSGKGRNQSAERDPLAATPGGRSTTGTGFRKPNPRCGKCGRVINGLDTAKGFKVCHCVDPVIVPTENRDAQRFQSWTELWARAMFRVLKPGAHILVCGSPRTYHRMGSGLEDAGFEIRDCLAWLYGSGFPKSLNLGEGLGTALKPAYEPIVLARKPFKGTVKGNVEKHGTGALNIDACRIACDGLMTAPTGGGAFRLDGFSTVDELRASALVGGKTPTGRDSRATLLRYEAAQGQEPTELEGRWPANVCLDELAALVLDEQSGELTSGGITHQPQRSGYEGGWSAGTHIQRDPDVGGASRFFYVAKPSREERDMGCYGLRERSGGEATARTDGTAGLSNPRAGAGRTGGARNFHPTVKPVELMRWLIRLVTPINGVVIDPFLGSGTTGMAARYEMRNFIGIEREREHLDIAERRIASVAPLFSEIA